MSPLVNPAAFADVDRLAGDFATAAPFPHVIIDDFLMPNAAAAVHDEARATTANVDASNDITQRQKVACTDWRSFGEQTSRLISYFNSAEYMTAKELPLPIVIQEEL